MAEMSTPENEELVARVYTQTLDDRTNGKEPIGAVRVVYEIEMLSQEVNSGASFEQYFRWASVAEISRVVGRLESLGLKQVATLAHSAIEAAFPEGLPASDDEKSELTGWSQDQEERLAALAEEFTEYNGVITNKLAAFYRKEHGGA